MEKLIAHAFSPQPMSGMQQACFHCQCLHGLHRQPLLAAAARTITPDMFLRVDRMPRWLGRRLVRLASSGMNSRGLALQFIMPSVLIATFRLAREYCAFAIAGLNRHGNATRKSPSRSSIISRCRYITLTISCSSAPALCANYSDQCRSG